MLKLTFFAWVMLFCACQEKKPAPKNNNGYNNYGVGSGNYYDSLNSYNNYDYNNSLNNPYAGNYSQYNTQFSIAAENLTTGDNIPANSTYIFIRPEVENKVRFFTAPPPNNYSYNNPGLNNNVVNNQPIGQVSRVIIPGSFSTARQLSLDTIAFTPTPGLFGSRNASITVCATSPYPTTGYPNNTGVPTTNNSTYLRDTCAPGEVSKQFYLEAPRQNVFYQQGNGYFGQQGGAYKSQSPGLLNNFFGRLLGQKRVQLPQTVGVVNPYTSQTTFQSQSATQTGSQQNSGNSPADILIQDPLNPLISLSTSRAQ